MCIDPTESIVFGSLCVKKLGAQRQLYLPGAFQLFKIITGFCSHLQLPYRINKGFKEVLVTV